MEEYRFEVYWKNEHTADVTISADRKSVIYKRYTSAIPRVPFLFDNPTVAQMYDFLETRCMPKRRKCLPEYLNALGLEEYNVWDGLGKMDGWVK